MSQTSGPGSTTFSVPGGEGAGTRIGSYTILRLLGEGGFGAVYEAEQEQPVRRRVALKVIKPGMDTREVIARFEAERQALALMDHPHIARVFDAGATEAGRPYFVMELMPGEPVTTFAIGHGLSIEQRLELFGQVCAAVQHAHAKGVIHRDLKPNNVLVAEQDGRPFARIIDFGIAKAIRGKLTDRTLQTEHELMMGTPLYMSPEQAEGRADIDLRTDVYALGVILYELLTDSTPIDSHSLRSAGYTEMQRIIHDVDPPLPSARLRQSGRIRVGTGATAPVDSRRLAARVRGDLDAITMKAIEKDRARRYASAGELMADLARYSAGQPVLAAAPGIGYRLRKAIRRHRLPLAVAALVLATALGTFVAGGRWNRPHGAPSSAVGAPSPKSIAVLPFENLSTDKDNAYFADGIQDTILTRLAGIGKFKVISRTSTAKYASHPGNLREIARELDVATVLEGSVQRSGNRVLINVQLIDARNDRHLWAQAYQRTLDNVFDVEGEVAQAVAEALDARLTAEQQIAVTSGPTRNPDAYDAYLRGLAHAQQAESGAVQAAADFERAVHNDPGFVLAWSWLAREHAWVYFSGEDPSAERSRKAREALETAERLAPGSVAALVARGYYDYRVERDFEGARQSFERAHALAPNDADVLWPMAMIARRQGHWKQSLELLDRTMASDPRNMLTIQSAVITLECVRDFANAQRLMEHALAFAPHDEGALNNQANLYLVTGDLAAVRKMRASLSGTPGSLDAWFPDEYFLQAREEAGGIAQLRREIAANDDPSQGGPLAAMLGEFYRRSGNTAAAESSYRKARDLLVAHVAEAGDDTVSMRLLAMVQAGLGDESAATAMARRAITVDAGHGDRYGGPKSEETLARIQARFGRKGEALDQLRHLLATPYLFPITVARLRQEPDWDNLRDEPGFRALLATPQTPTY